MKAICLTLIVLAGCAGSPQPSDTRLTGERDPACATCPPDCCTAEQKTAAKSECCAAEQAKAAAKSECCTAADSVPPKSQQ